MFLSARNIFTKAHNGWQGYKDSIELEIPERLYSLDSYLNATVSDSGSYFIFRIEQIEGTMIMLPSIAGEDLQYYQLAINLSENPALELPDNIIPLGHDLSDGTSASSLLNCGPWKGKLKPIAQRINENGLLTLEDAKLAQKILPEVWGEQEHHAHVDIWRICKLA